VNTARTATGYNRRRQIRRGSHGQREPVADALVEGWRINAARRKLAGDLDTNGTAWLDANVHVLELGASGKKAESLESYRTESIPNVGHFRTLLRTT